MKKVKKRINNIVGKETKQQVNKKDERKMLEEYFNEKDVGQ